MPLCTCCSIQCFWLCNKSDLDRNLHKAKKSSIMCFMRIAEIYLGNLAHNIAQIKNNLRPGVKICAAVKADAYGHGAVRCAKTAVECGAAFLSVATVDEGIELRRSEISCPILVLSLCDANEMDALIEHDLTPLVGDTEYVDLIESAAKKNFDSKSKKKSSDGMQASEKKFSVHLAVDTGMGRIGCFPDEAKDLAKKIASSQFLSLGGVCTHFASADETDKKHREFAQSQYEQFSAAINSIRAEKIDAGIVHCANSAALLAHPEWQFDMVRPGIILYGYDAGKITREYLSQKGIRFEPKPVMALVASVSAVRAFPKGMSVSYGCTWTSDTETKIAVLTIGYADGLLRRASPGIEVAINGKKYPVRGRICMDQCMAEIGMTDDVKRFDRAVIFGPEESGALCTAQDLADAQGTIPYEILTCVSKRVKRVYL